MEMESPSKPNNMNGVLMGSSTVKMVSGISCRRERSYDILLRILGFFLTLVSVIVVASDKQTKILQLTLIQDVPPVQVPVTAKWHFSSAFVYLVVSNAIACLYAAASLIYIVAEGNIKYDRSLSIVIMDAVITTLLFSANGSAAAVGLIGRYGNRHTHWNKVCDVVDTFCRQMTAAFTLSLIGSLVFLWLLFFSLFHLHKKSLR